MKLKQYTVRQILLISFLPICLLSVIITCLFISKQCVLTAGIHREAKVSSHIEEVSNTIRALQSERTMCLDYLSSKDEGKNFTASLGNSGVTTATLRQAFYKLYHKKINRMFHKETSEVFKLIKGLEALRKDVQNRDVTQLRVTEYYSDIIGRLLTITEMVAIADTMSDTTKKIIAYLAWLRVEELIELQRIAGMSFFKPAVYDVEIHKTFDDVAELEKSYLSRFILYADSSMCSSFITAFKDYSADYVQEMIQKIADSSDYRSIPKITKEQWHVNVHSKIELIDHVKKMASISVANASENAYSWAKLSLRLYSFIGIVFLAVSVLLIMYITKCFSNSLCATQKIIARFADDNFVVEHEIDHVSKELTEISTYLQLLKESGIKKLEMEEQQSNLLKDQLDAKEKEDLLKEQNRRKLIAEAQGHLEGFVAVSLHNNNVITGLAKESHDLDHVSEAALVMSAAIEELTSTISELNEKSTLIAEQSISSVSVSDETAGTVNEIVRVIEQINGSTDKVTASIEQFSSVTSEIGSMILDINDIAEQTNILALNATIEATRAGEAGKGFSVVASEVKTLASQTASVTTRISNSIGRLNEELENVLTATAESASAADSGKEISLEVSSSVNKVSSSIKSVNDMTYEMSELLGQQSQAVDEIFSRVSEVTNKVNISVHGLKDIFTLLEVTTQTIEDRLLCFADLGTDQSIIELAKNDHSKFKRRILNTILGNDSWQADDVPDHHFCRLGKWYYDVASPEMKRMKEYKDLESLHERVHSLTKDILANVAARNIESALSQMHELDQISEQVINILTAINMKIANHRV